MSSSSSCSSELNWVAWNREFCMEIPWVKDICEDGSR